MVDVTMPNILYSSAQDGQSSVVELPDVDVGVDNLICQMIENEEKYNTIAVNLCEMVKIKEEEGK